MTIAIDLDTHLASNLAAIAQQAVGNTQSFAHYANLAFTKDRAGAGRSRRPVGRSGPGISRRF